MRRCHLTASERTAQKECLPNGTLRRTHPFVREFAATDETVRASNHPACTLFPERMEADVIGRQALLRKLPWRLRNPRTEFWLELAIESGLLEIGRLTSHGSKRIVSHVCFSGESKMEQSLIQFAVT
jgi:hypothetical protein